MEWRHLGLSDREILERQPDLTVADIESAWDYYDQHREEIDNVIRQDAEA